MPKRKPKSRRNATDDRAERPRAEGEVPFATAYHAPVLCTPVVRELVSDRAGCYVDGTLGGGGHSAALLAALAPEGTVIGIDRDVDALATARARLADDAERGRFRTIHGNFGDLKRLLRELEIDQVDGILLDLGVSSYQLDTAGRGFSYQAEGELDMRMNRTEGVSAYDLVNGWDERALRELMRDLGEEPRASRIARAIVAARPLESTTALADVVRSAVPTREELKSLSRVFQAIRIAVNAELDALEQALRSSLDVLRPGGRIAVISYHSLEDRRVKRFLRYGNLEGQPEKDFYGQLITPWREITRKPIAADEHEVALNPRARSARLRVAERAPPPDTDDTNDTDDA